MSVEAAPVERSDVPSAVRELAGDLLPQAPRLAREMNEHLFAMMPELRERDDGELPEETRASCEVNIAQILRLLSSGAGPDALVLPPEAAESGSGDGPRRTSVRRSGRAGQPLLAMRGSARGDPRRYGMPLVRGEKPRRRARLLLPRCGSAPDVGHACRRGDWHGTSHGDDGPKSRSEGGPSCGARTSIS